MKAILFFLLPLMLLVSSCSKPDPVIITQTEESVGKKSIADIFYDMKLKVTSIDIVKTLSEKPKEVSSKIDAFDHIEESFDYSISISAFTYDNYTLDFTDGILTGKRYKRR